MVADLHDARARLEQESESRQRLQRGLERVDKLITLGQLSAALAHEIGTPLQILHGRARALLARAHDPEGTRKNAEILVEQTERITRIVEQLLRFARHRTTHALPMQLPSVAQSVLDLLGVEARRRGLRLTLDVAPDLPEVEADPDQVQQIVLNLMTNAFAATPNGGSVEVRLEVGVLPRPDGSSARSARLVVKDTGRGIPADIRERLFEPFFTTRDAEGGTGLGLSVVKAIVTEHRGAISVESELGAGSSFAVDLPERSLRDQPRSAEDDEATHSHCRRR
jgi:signal transduction histidine kinase